MMRIKVEEVGKGLHPNEVVVAINTTDGTERLRVARRSISDGALEIGGPIRVEQSRVLIELPRETQRGAWRVWVGEDQILEPKRLKA